MDIKLIIMNKELYYNIYGEFYNINKFRELKCITHHGNNRLAHINRVAKLSFIVSKKLGLDYISCTRGAILHDFFTLDDINSKKCKYRYFLKSHPNEALINAKNFFSINEIECDIILTHMYPITRKRPSYKEAKIVCIVDKIVSIYEFFRYQIKFSANLYILFLFNLILK